jgi:hypothetical protein
VRVQVSPPAPLDPQGPINLTERNNFLTPFRPRYKEAIE